MTLNCVLVNHLEDDYGGDDDGDEGAEYDKPVHASSGVLEFGLGRGISMCSEIMNRANLTLRITTQSSSMRCCF